MPFPTPETAETVARTEMMKIRTIKAGSLTKLVEHLAPPIASFDEVDPGYIMAFMTTYRTFSTMTEIVDLLFER